MQIYIYIYRVNFVFGLYLGYNEKNKILFYVFFCSSYNYQILQD